MAPARDTLIEFTDASLYGSRSCISLSFRTASYLSVSGEGEILEHGMIDLP